MNNIDELINKIINDNKINRINDNLYLTNEQIEILKRYNINYNTTINELIYEIEDILNEEYIEDLDRVSKSISEFNYYHNTNK